LIVRWDDAQAGDVIGRAAGAVNVCLRRLQLAAGETAQQSDPAAEEIVFVLEGAGSWQYDGRTSNLRPGDCIVRFVHQEGHTLRAGLTA